MDFATAVGQTLRRLRTERGLTLQGVHRDSDGSFKASALSGYERGERSISLERFRELTAFYSVPAHAVLRDILVLLGEEEPKSDVIDLTGRTIDLTEADERAARGNPT